MYSNGDYMKIASVNDSAATMFNITGLHPNRAYKFSVQALSDAINSSKADCPDESCLTWQAGMYILIAVLYVVNDFRVLKKQLHIVI